MPVVAEQQRIFGERTIDLQQADGRTFAAVEGEIFTAEVIVAVQGIGVVQVVGQQW